jgi:2-dehydropantoate 2-reductase
VSDQPLRIGIFGAGAIGGYLGVRLSAATALVTLIGRRALAEHAGDLEAVGLDGTSAHVGVPVTTDPSALSDAEVCLVTVKSGDSAEAGRILREHLPQGALVVSLQNGIRNVATLTETLGRPVVAGMVTYNVRREGRARFRRATSGPIMIGNEGDRALLGRLVTALRAAGEEVELRRDMEAVQLTKLLLNLNNGVCGTTGLSIADSLRNRASRRVFAMCLREGLRAARATGRRITRIGPLAPALVARLLPLPNGVFLRLAPKMIAIDPAARLSTLQDLDRGHRTEIDYLNGEIVGFGASTGVPTPANAFVTAYVHRLEGMKPPLPFMTPEELLREVRESRGSRAPSPGRAA